MYYYKIYGLYVKSDYKLEEAMEIPENSVKEIDITICADEIEPQLTTETEYDKKAEGRIVYRFEEARGWIRAKGQGCFVMRNGQEITYKLKAGYDSLVVNQIILCAALPTILGQRKMLAVHGSGILWGNKAIIVSGISGSGKSTLTAGLLENGGIFMADDTVALQEKEDGIYAQPAYPQQKLCPDAIDEKVKSKGELILLPPDDGVQKYAVRLKDGFCREGKELEAIVILNAAEVEEVSIKEIQGSEKIKYLLNNLYRYKIYVETGMSADIFRKCIQIANQVKIYVLTRPKQGMTVGEQIEKLKKELHKG